MSFAARFAYLLESIVLLAPAGLLRTIPREHRQPCWRWCSILPKAYLRRQLVNLLGVNLSPTTIDPEAIDGFLQSKVEVTIDP